MTRSTDITSFTEHRQHLRDHFLQIRETGRPLYITKNGTTDGVLLSPEAYDALVAKAELAESLATIEKSMEDVRANRGTDFEDAIRGIADKLGLRLER